MAYEFDKTKSKKNQADKSRGFGLEASEGFDWDRAVTLADTRHDYGEARYVSYGLIDERLHAMVWTKRGMNIRVISLRKTNEREKRWYEQERKRH